MKRVQYINLCLMLAATVAGCSEGAEQFTPPPTEPETEGTDIPIRWNMQPIDGMQSSRALVEDTDAKTAEEILQEACAPDKSERIVVWGDYVYGSTTHEGFFDGANLAYYGISDAEDSPSGWDYDGEDRYWTLGGKYKFRAYYPKTGVDIVSSSNATTFVFQWNSIQSQTDLLVAYKEIDTWNWNLNEPVPLDMRHALAALKFNFRFIDGYYTEDRLTSCWLENSVKDDFACVGVLAYGGSTDAEAMTWAKSYAYEPGTEMYKWTYDTGIPIKSEAGTNTALDATDDDVITLATAYTEGATTGEKYSTNDGWLLVIPQELSGNVYLCFTTQKGGADNVYRAKIPADKGLTGGKYLPGYKYNYTVQISKTNLILTLSIAAWNKLDSSHDIKF